MSTLPAGFVNTGDPDGTFDSTSTYNLGAGEDNLDQDFGYTPGTIPFTGSNSGMAAAMALMLVLGGIALVITSGAIAGRTKA